MWTTGNDGWIKYGWGPDLKNEWFRGADLVVDYSDTSSEIIAETMMGAAHSTINLILEKYPSPYYLFCSGGLDSQAMIWSWFTSGKPFSVVSIKYISDRIWYNKGDQEQLISFCSQHSIPITFLTFDIINFLENNLREVSAKFMCTSPNLCAHIKMSEMIQSGTVLYSGNTILLNSAMLSFAILGIDRYASHLHSVSSQRQVIPSFLSHTPQLAYSIKTWMQGQIDKYIMLNDNYAGRVLSYRENGFPVLPQVKKSTGFELLKERYDSEGYRVPVRDKLRFGNRSSTRVYDFLFRYALEDHRSFQTARLVVKMKNRS